MTTTSQTSHQGPDAGQIAQIISWINGGQFERGAEAARALTKFYPRHPFGWSALAMGLHGMKRTSQAADAMRMAAQISRDADAYNNLGLLLHESGRCNEAEVALREAVRIRSNHALASYNLGRCLMLRGRIADAEPQLRSALAKQPDLTEAHSILLLLLNYISTSSVEEGIAIARHFGEVARSKVRAPLSHAPVTAAPQTLRVGFVSGDMRDHPVGYFIENLFASLDPQRIAIYAYPTTADEDVRSARLRSHCRAWRLIAGLSDEEAATAIHRDSIHILIDLAGHTASNRLGVFAWKPAPVQVSWLGYFATTGVAEIDYVLADPVSVPAAHRSQFTERIWHLPRTRMCFTPPEDAPPVAPLPALRSGFITFGSFQNLAKVGDAVIALWSRILATHSGAMLRLQNRQLDDPQARSETLQRFAAAGVAPSRIRLFGKMQRRDYLAAHAEVDILLDTFPFNGGTTTCEALWMGVPTVTFAGDRMIARQGASLLAAAGLPDWIAETPVEYVGKAVSYAHDPEALAALRKILRDKVRVSPLFDAARFAGLFEEAMTGMWRAAQSRNTIHVEPGVP